MVVAYSIAGLEAGTDACKCMSPTRPRRLPGSIALKLPEGLSLTLSSVCGSLAPFTPEDMDPVLFARGQQSWER
jgi:hypothetical protein